jgi:hypothetical protein
MANSLKRILISPLESLLGLVFKLDLFLVANQLRSCWLALNYRDWIFESREENNLSVRATLGLVVFEVRVFNHAHIFIPIAEFYEFCTSECLLASLLPLWVVLLADQSKVVRVVLQRTRILNVVLIEEWKKFSGWLCLFLENRLKRKTFPSVLTSRAGVELAQ